MKKELKKTKKSANIKERKNTISKWHKQQDREFFSNLKKEGLYEYESKYILEEDTWSDYFSFQQCSWDDVL